MLILTGTKSNLSLTRAFNSYRLCSVTTAFRGVMLTIAILLGTVILGIPLNRVLASNGEPIHYESELAQVNRVLSAKLDVSVQRPDSWLHLEQVANAYLERASLTGDFEDYFSADTVLAKAFALAGEGSGPVLSRAALNFSIHRLPAVEADLAKAEAALLVDTTTMETIQGIRADVSFYRAQYLQAKQAYDQLDLSNPSVVSASRLAHYYAHIADYKEAERWFEKAQDRVLGRSPHLRSWLHLQLGILDLEQGQLDDALAHYQEGLDLFPGYWLLEEHVAEIDMLQGRDKKAEDSYRDLIQRTGSPLFMGSLANILANRAVENDQVESAKWQEKADKLYEARIARMPELTSGHAIEHFLNSEDSERAFQLALANYQLRPGGQAALLLIQAHTALGQVSQASALLESVLKSPYRSADLHATAGLIYQAQDQLQLAETHNTLAIAINPLAVKDTQWLHVKLESSQLEPVVLNKKSSH